MGDSRGLHIGVDGRELTGRPTGVGRYLRAVIETWARDAALPHRVTVFAAEPAPAGLMLSDRFTWTTVASAPAGTIWEQRHLPRAAAAAGLDVFFAAGYTAPLRLACPFVVAIYDVSFWAHPEWFARREGFRRRWLTRAAARRAQSVITISEFSAAEIVRHLGIPRDRIRLARPGPPPAVRDAGATPEHASGPAGSAMVLFVGSLFGRRHIPELMRAFALVRARVPDARLVLVGDNRTQPRIDPRDLAAQAGIASHTEWHEYVDEATLDRLYGDARAFVFLSEYEGFALTPFEAIARGVPPVLLDTPVAREVYGEAARMTSLEPAAIADAILSLLQDDAARDALLGAGRQRLAALSWTDTARTILTALEEAAAR